MFGQYVIEGMYEEERLMRAGSSEIMVVPEPSLDIKTPKANVREVVILLKQYLILLLKIIIYGLHLLDGKSDRPSSGVALKIKDLERFEDFQDDIELWELYEKELYQVERIIARANNIALPENIGLKFNEPEYPMSYRIDGNG